MTLTEQQLRRYRRYRREGETAKLALIHARGYHPKPDYEFLAKLTDSPCKVSGTVLDGAFECVVKVEPDYDSRLGDDDVTGTFHDGDKRDESWVRCTVWGYNSEGAHWYQPSNYDRDHLMDDLRQQKIGRSRIHEEYRKRIKRAMYDDAHRSYCGVVATLYQDGEEVAEHSMWGIDILPGYDGSGYIVEAANDLIAECIGDIKGQVFKLIETKKGQVAQLEALARKWTEEVTSSLTDIATSLEPPTSAS